MATVLRRFMTVDSEKPILGIDLTVDADAPFPYMVRPWPSYDLMCSFNLDAATVLFEN